ncbi:LpxI family protein [Stratiformator vulcanicus]|uniref:DUF1009 domain-containing protein n=1 Tax=Stratiformator vulcanicus TaxID=2527980 RepID=A0A517R394_9PLAN|nr:UDP-2,3-diacylglucosamine diphosphatase LpxI [Stratiformator vulcanicus]QDT38333.1 hypothetical protein Pan189_27240 [Stratiformator vulcanicus]
MRVVSDESADTASEADGQAAPKPASRRIGLLAGAGRFPIVFAEAARREGHVVVGMGIRGMVWPELESACDHFREESIGKVGRAVRLFKRNKVQSIVMAGKVEKKELFRPGALIRNMPDLRMLHLIYTYCRKDKKDDTLLTAVIREFERDNFKFESALDYAPELLVKHGFLTRRRPSCSQWEDIRFGWDIAKEMGRLDIGQTIIVRNKAVIAVEAIEGTDRAIRRAGELCRRGGFTVVKVAKPQQDMRFDVPTIGLDTLRTMHEVGGRVLAIECDKTILLDEPEVISLANKLGIAIVSLNADELSLSAAA